MKETQPEGGEGAGWSYTRGTVVDDAIQALMLGNSVIVHAGRGEKERRVCAV
jgi:hypothetical protein